ncbi:MAG: glycosyltransferase family 2 protein [Zetaproteobacteria bacterium]|nr:MAG: glycosyltransferase family 2 protein [Zetaproteobacteria bacterium]
MSPELVHDVELLILVYFALVNSGYLLLNLSASVAISRYLETVDASALPSIYAGFELPISVLVPAYNEEVTIVSSIQSMLALDYPEHEVVVVNDGSSDDTLRVVREAFAMEEIPEPYWQRIETKPVRAIYRSSVFPNLCLVDKENGGKADALNAGINVSRYPLFCTVDADSIIHKQGLQRAVRPFMEDDRVIACGGIIRAANGCEIREGVLLKVGLPNNPLALFQIVEFMRAFLFGRLGWELVNSLLIISGAFGLFRKDAVVAVGGYRTDTVGEDMELVVRLHRKMREWKQRYRITFIADAVCWTELPERLGILKNQRVRWHRGVSESLTMNWDLLFHRRGGVVGWLAFPFMVVVEWWGPVVEIAGYVLMLLLYLWGYIAWSTFLVFLFAAIALGTLLSITALLLEELSFNTYPKAWHVLVLLIVALLENFGYRQMVAFFRLMGFMRWLFRQKGGWGKMTRHGRWNKRA